MMQNLIRLRLRLMLLVTLFLIPTGIGTTWAESATVTISGIYDQSGARSMLKMINDFRSGAYDKYDRPSDYDSWKVKPSSGQTWCRTSDGGIEIISGLEDLQYDYTLEKIAMLRAIETAVYWDHERPDRAAGPGGKAYPDGYFLKGENIACGYGTASSVMKAWMETDEDSKGQGHRRNMLMARFAAVGVAHVEHNGWDFWVQEFGNPLLDGTQTAVQNGLGSAKVTFSTDRVTPVGLVTPDKSDTIAVGIGETVRIPETKIRLKETEPGRLAHTALVSADLTLTVADPSIVSMSGNALTGLKVGTTTLDTTFAGRKLSYKIVVEAKPLKGAVLTIGGNAAYTGKEVKPAVTVKLSGKALRQGTDYTVAYTNNIKTGKAKVTVTGIGNYGGTLSKTFQIRLAKGYTFKDKTSGGVYKVTKVSSAAKAEVTFVKPVSAKKTSITIPASVKISGTVCRVTAVSANAFRSNRKVKKIVIGKYVASIGKNAFRGAKNLSTIQIKTKKLSAGRVGAGAFAGISKEAVFKLPSSKKKAYQKLLLKKGAEKTMTFQ